MNTNFRLFLLNLDRHCSSLADIHDGNRKVTSSKYSPKFPNFVFNLESALIVSHDRFRPITHVHMIFLVQSHRRPHGKSRISFQMFEQAWRKKSIKTYFLKGKAHESGDCTEDQNEKKCNCTKANRTGKRIGGQTTQNGRECTKWSDTSYRSITEYRLAS